tara:strand:+ start:161 stop:523 length:363 start_codon:yes stop_codon:yes gene_type:complete
MDRKQLEDWTKTLALRVFKLVDALPKTPSGRTIAGQLTRCASSVGANYRAAGRARSRKEFAAKLGTVEEEVDETCYWLELIIEGQILKPGVVQPLLDEAKEITAIIASSRKTARSNLKSS